MPEITLTLTFAQRHLEVLMKEAAFRDISLTELLNRIFQQTVEDNLFVAILDD
jgi:hypothetical protein